MPCGIKEVGEGLSRKDFDFNLSEVTYPGGPTQYSSGTYSGWDVCLGYNYGRSKGVCTPNYHARVKKGELIPHTPYEFYEIEGSVQHPGKYYQRNDPNGTWYRYDFVNGTIFRGVCMDTNEGWYPTKGDAEGLLEDFNDEVQKCAADIYSRNSHDTLTFLAEIGKTRDMFRDWLGKAIKHKPKRPVNWSHSLSDVWLDVRYGWRPLLYDMRDINEAISSLKKKQTRYVARSRTKSDESTLIEDSQTVSSCTYSNSVTDTVSVATSGHIAADFLNKAAFQTNPFVTAWELVPYSFIVDWMVNVGHALEAASFVLNSSSYVASGGQYVEISRRAETTATEWYDHCSGNLSVIGNSSIKFRRRTPTSVSLLPQFRPNLNTWKVADLIALFITGSRPSQRR